MRKGEQVLEFIGSKGEVGAGLTEIQLFVWTVIKGYKEEDFWKKSKSDWNDSKPLRVTRGWYCDALYGTCYNRGLLHSFCKKNGRKWVLVSMPKEGEAIYTPESYKDAMRRYF